MNIFLNKLKIYQNGDEKTKYALAHIIFDTNKIKVINKRTYIKQTKGEQYVRLLFVRCFNLKLCI